MGFSRVGSPFDIEYCISSFLIRVKPLSTWISIPTQNKLFVLFSFPYIDFVIKECARLTSSNNGGFLERKTFLEKNVTA